MIRITCPTCQKPILVDETRLPMREVSFPCPACKASLTVDRRMLGQGAPAPLAARPAAPPMPVSTPTHATQPPQPVPAPPAPAAGAPSAPGREEPELLLDEDLAAKALIVGVDSPSARQAAQALGFQPIYFPTVEAGRDWFLQEYPPVVFLCPTQLTRPPLEDLQAMTNIGPADRRRSFFILLADGLRTLDGNAAFFYNVNLVVANRDVGNIDQIYHDAEAYHRRMYHSFWAAQREVHQS